MPLNSEKHLKNHRSGDRKTGVDYRLYLVTDSNMTGRKQLVDYVLKAADGGVTIVQYREKSGSTAQMIREAESLLHELAKRNIPLLINDRVDIALAVGAAGVHLGQNDMDPVTARRLLGPDAIIGYSVETFEQAHEAMELDVDYLGVSPVFSTPTKTDIGNPWEIDGLKELRSFTSKPLVAIGGLNRDTIPHTLAAGADGVAVVSAICNSDNPEASALELRDIISRATP